MGELGSLLLDYSAEGDLLAMGNGSQAKGGGYSVTSNSFFTGFYAERDKTGCVGFELLDAARMLTPYLNGGVSKGGVCEGELSASYSNDTDTLTLVSVQESVTHDESVADGLVAHCNQHGQAVGFTLKNAGKVLLPHLQEWKTQTGAVA